MGITTQSRTECAISCEEPLAGAAFQKDLFGTPGRKLFSPLGVAKRAVWRPPWEPIIVVLAIVIKTMMRAKKVRLVVLCLGFGLGLFLATSRHFFLFAVVE